MFKVLALLIAGSGIFLITFWAKDNLKKGKLFWFALGMIIVAITLIMAIQLNLEVSPGVGEKFEKIDETEIIKMRELLSIS